MSNRYKDFEVIRFKKYIRYCNFSSLVDLNGNLNIG